MIFAYKISKLAQIILVVSAGVGAMLCYSMLCYPEWQKSLVILQTTAALITSHQQHQVFLISILAQHFSCGSDFLLHTFVAQFVLDKQRYLNELDSNCRGQFGDTSQHRLSILPKFGGVFFPSLFCIVRCFLNSVMLIVRGLTVYKYKMFLGCELEKCQYVIKSNQDFGKNANLI